MATTTEPLSDGTGELLAPPPADRLLRFVDVRASLLPAEVVTARAAERMRQRVLIGLAAVVAVLALGYGFSWWQTHSANSDLAALQQRSTELNAQTQKYGPLVEAQSRTTSIHAQLAQLMTGDLSWRQLLTTLRAKAPAGTSLTDVTGTVGNGSGSAATGGYSPLTGTATQVGTLTLTGTAPDKTAVAAYADQLATVKGLAAPTPTSVVTGTGATHGSGVTFTMSVVITSDALGGRYSAPVTGTPTTGSSTAGSPTSAAPATTGGN